MSTYNIFLWGNNKKYLLMVIASYKRNILTNIFSFLHENIHCGYLLEAPHRDRGASNK